MKQVKCPNCGKIYYEDLQSCPHCGCPNDEHSQQTNGNGTTSGPSVNKTTASTSKTCKECGHPLDDYAQVCPNCGRPTETASASAFMDGTVLNEGRCTEAKSTIIAASVLKWGNILAIINLASAIIYGAGSCAFYLITNYFGYTEICIWTFVVIIFIFLGILSYIITKLIAKSIWAIIMLLVNISTTLKRKEMALIKCSHCGKPVSDRAVKCPHCGNSLGKATIIQYGSKAEAVQRKSRISPAAMTGKIFFLAAILASVVPCVIQFIKNNGFDWLKYSYLGEGSVLFGHYLASNQLAAIEMAAALLSIILAVYGIIKLCNSEVSSWKFWLLSTIVAWLPVLVIFLIQVTGRY